MDIDAKVETCFRDLAYSYNWQLKKEGRMVAHFNEHRCCFNAITDGDWVLDVTRIGSNKLINIFKSQNRLKNFATVYIILQDLATRCDVNRIYIEQQSTLSLRHFERIINKFAPSSWAITCEELNGNTYYVLTPPQT